MEECGGSGGSGGGSGGGGNGAGLSGGAPATAAGTDAGSDTSDDASNAVDSDDAAEVMAASADHQGPASGDVAQLNGAAEPTPSAAAAAPTSASNTAEKFKTPYKPKFHVKAAEENVTGAPADPPASSSSALSEPSESVDGAGVGRPQLPSPGFLQARISQIISENQAIVETMDPLWPRRYVRQSSRDAKDAGGVASCAAAAAAPSSVTSSSLTTNPL